MNRAAVTKTIRRLHSVPILLAACGWIILATNGCMVGPDFHPPHPDAPASWTGVTEAPAAQPSVPTAQPAELAQWWGQFNDPMLTTLVEEALKTNLDVELTIARLRQARAAQGIAIAGLWPTVNGSAGFQRERPAHAPDGTSQTQNLYQAGFDAVWELDLFGGQRRNIESAEANTRAAIEGIRDAQVTLVSEVALDYIQLRGSQQEIVIARNNLKAQQDTLEITRQRATVGFNSALDIANAEANVAATEAQIPVYETSARQSIYALSVLLAKPPAELLDRLAPAGDLPGVPARIPAGLPSDLLRRRADVRQAEAQVHAATAQIGVATAALFPQFTLTGTLGWQSSQLSTFLSGSGRTESFGPSVSWQIFQGGAIVSNIHVQEALRDQAFITYRKTVLSAFQDVENALIAFTKEQQHFQSLQDSVVANAKAVDLSLTLYTEGLLDFLNVLIAERSLYTAEDALVQSRSNIATDLISLYKALGGGWETIPADTDK